jgi:DNA-binding HxlR family transcriptional regulator
MRSSKGIAIHGLKNLSSNILKNIRTSNKQPKTPKELERHLKGVSNHWRITVLRYTNAHPGVTLDALCQQLKGDYKTLSFHTQKLVQAGLIDKKYVGHTVEHYLTPYGKLFNAFLNSF